MLVAAPCSAFLYVRALCSDQQFLATQAFVINAWSPERVVLAIRKGTRSHEPWWIGGCSLSRSHRAQRRHTISTSLSFFLNKTKVLYMHRKIYNLGENKPPAGTKRTRSRSSRNRSPSISRVLVSLQMYYVDQNIGS